MAIWQKRATKEQQKALLALYRRFPQSPTYLQFRRNAFWSFETLMVQWSGMIVGIEPDGYTHS